MTLAWGIVVLVLSLLTVHSTFAARRYNKIARGFLLLALRQMLEALERERAGKLTLEEFQGLLHGMRWLLGQPDSVHCMEEAIEDRFRQAH